MDNTEDSATATSLLNRQKRELGEEGAWQEHFTLYGSAGSCERGRAWRPEAVLLSSRSGNANPSQAFPRSSPTGTVFSMFCRWRRGEYRCIYLLVPMFCFAVYL